MKRIIVDASVILAGLFKDGAVRDLLLNYEGTQYLAPAYLTAEVDRHLTEVVSRTGKPEFTVRAVLEDVLSTIELVPVEIYSASMKVALQIANRAGAAGDADYIAMALHFHGPIWTFDKDFLRARGVRTLRTRDVEMSEAR